MIYMESKCTEKVEIFFKCKFSKSWLLIVGTFISYRIIFNVPRLSEIGLAMG